MSISVPLLAAVLLSLCVSSLYSAPARRAVDSNCSQDVVMSEIDPEDRLYNALYLSRKMTFLSILVRNDERVRFYQSLERIAKGALSEEINGDESVVGQALKEVLTQLAKDACSWAVYNDTETWTVDCTNLTDIAASAKQRRTQLIESHYQTYRNASVEAISLAVQVLPEMEDMLSHLKDIHSNFTVGKIRKAWVATYISRGYQSYVCPLAA